MLYRIPATRKIERRGQCSRCIALSSTNNVESSPTKPKVNCTCLERQIQFIGNHLSPFSLNFLLYTTTPSTHHLQIPYLPICPCDLSRCRHIRVDDAGFQTQDRVSRPARQHILSVPTPAVRASHLICRTGVLLILAANFDPHAPFRFVPVSPPTIIRKCLGFVVQQRSRLFLPVTIIDVFSTPLCLELRHCR
jgi:hypothetical protein